MGWSWGQSTSVITPIKCLKGLNSKVFHEMFHEVFMMFNRPKFFSVSQSLMGSVMGSFMRVVLSCITTRVKALEMPGKLKMSES